MENFDYIKDYFFNTESKFPFFSAFAFIFFIFGFISPFVYFFNIIKFKIKHHGIKFK